MWSEVVAKFAQDCHWLQKIAASLSASIELGELDGPQRALCVCVCVNETSYPSLFRNVHHDDFEQTGMTNERKKSFAVVFSLIIINNWLSR